MTRPQPICCKELSVWVDNVPGKEYWYCRVCRREVIAPITLEEPPEFTDRWSDGPTRIIGLKEFLDSKSLAGLTDDVLFMSQESYKALTRLYGGSKGPELLCDSNGPNIEIPSEGYDLPLSELEDEKS